MQKVKGLQNAMYLIAIELYNSNRFINYNSFCVYP